MDPTTEGLGRATARPRRQHERGVLRVGGRHVGARVEARRLPRDHAHPLLKGLRLRLVVGEGYGLLTRGLRHANRLRPDAPCGRPGLAAACRDAGARLPPNERPKSLMTSRPSSASRRG